jgi:hypothetical protein
VETRREKRGTGRKERKEGTECAMRRKTMEHMWDGCSEIREGEKGTSRNTE